LSETSGGSGWFGTVQVGCDYQFASSWVIGAFADYDFASIKGDFSSSGGGNIGEEKMRSAWAAGGRVGWTPFDRLLVFFSAEYTQAYFNRIDLISTFAPNVPAGLYYPAHTYHGWFVGSGYEYAIGWLPGLTWKTEYRFAGYRADNVPLLFTATGLSAGEAINSRKYTHMVRSELVWRFGGGAVSARY
jgi:outer membrane immunogenic protein